jgi:methylmalonyl-CoA mutase C-terminal domain/subunit
VSILKKPGHKIKILIATIGLDGHDRGAKVIAQALKESGMNVLYLGIRNTPQSIVDKAISNSVDLIGISSLSGGYLNHFMKTLELLKQKNVDISIIGGGIIPEDDKQLLIKAGIKDIFSPGTPLKTIISRINQIIEENHKES